MRSLLRPSRVLSALVLLAALPACSGGGGGGTAVQTGTISGTVSTAAGGVPNAGIALSGGGTATTDAAGQYAFANVATGPHQLTLTVPAGFQTAPGVQVTQSVNVTAGATVTASWMLVSAGGGSTANEIHLSAASFDPASTTVARGTTVRWINDAAIPHTITPDNASQPGAWTSASVSAAGQQFEHTFNTAGTFDYHCAIHAGMTGRVTVTQ